MRKFVRYLRRRATASVRAMVGAGVTREEAGEALFDEMSRAVGSERRLAAAVEEAERRVCHLAQSAFWRLGEGRRKKRRQGGGGVAVRVRKERLAALVESVGKQRLAEVRRRQRELDESVEPCMRLEGTGLVSHVPVPAWSRRALCSDEWREVECSYADTRVDWAAAPRMGGPVGPCVKRRRVHYDRWDRLRDIYDTAGLQRVRRWDGQGWVDEWVQLGGPSGPMYGDLDLSGVT